MRRTRGRAATALAGCAAVIATPGSAEFHHYLSPNAYTARFGPSAAHAAAIGSSCGTPSLSAAPSPGFDDEAQLDSEAVYALAPGASQLMVLPGVR
jgi:hypothetical protein